MDDFLKQFMYITAAVMVIWVVFIMLVVGYIGWETGVVLNKVLQEESFVPESNWRIAA